MQSRCRIESFPDRNPRATTPLPNGPCGVPLDAACASLSARWCRPHPNIPLGCHLLNCMVLTSRWCFPRNNRGSMGFPNCNSYGNNDMIKDWGYACYDSDQWVESNGFQSWQSTPRTSQKTRMINRKPPAEHLQNLPLLPCAPDIIHKPQGGDGRH